MVVIQPLTTRLIKQNKKTKNKKKILHVWLCHYVPVVLTCCVVNNINHLKVVSKIVRRLKICNEATV